MSSKPLSTPPRSEPQDREEPLDQTVGGSVTEAEKQRIAAALDNSGWNMSRGVRMVMMAFVESADVRDAVFAAIRKRHEAAA